MTYNLPKVSVLIPSYNYAQYISEAIESVLNQSFKDFELIIIDNKSDDNTIEIVNTYIKKDFRIKLIINDENIGMYRNYNNALLQAKGKYIKFLNADDKFHHNLLKDFIDILDRYPEVSLVSSKRQYFGKNNEIVNVGYSCKGLNNGKELIPKILMHSNFIGEPTTVMFRKKDLNIGFFNPELKMFADLDMWIRLLEIGDLYMFDEVYSYFRIHDNQGTVYLNKTKKDNVINYLQLYYFYINKLLFSSQFEDKNKKYLIKRSYMRFMLKLAKNSKLTEDFAIFFSFKIYTMYFLVKIFNPLRIIYNKFFKNEK